jgi:hypothetical protein
MLFFFLACERTNIWDHLTYNVVKGPLLFLFVRKWSLCSFGNHKILWRYRCDAEWLAASENEVDEEDGDRDTF